MKKKKQIPSVKVKKQKGKPLVYDLRLISPPTTTVDSEPYNGVVTQISNCIIWCN